MEKLGVEPVQLLTQVFNFLVMVFLLTKVLYKPILRSGRRLEAEIIEKAHKEASLILDKGRKELELEKIELEKQLRSKTIEIASNMVEAVLSQVLDVKAHQKIINKKLADLAKLAK
ncbi:hypothetical protein HZB96_00460 [Candidatus Gottesmanbacteria bacterium]|nr:hypothetical protein [Candidatus Gottesmanbacteria bacterium]